MDHFKEESEDDYLEFLEHDGHYDEDRDTLKRCRHALGITRSYVPTWTPQDAFREFCQNWKDAIMESFNLAPEQFCLEILESENDFIATAHRQGQVRKNTRQDTLGFIRYSKKKGVLELANFSAQLGRPALDMGVTTKRDNRDMAGTHGEGFKVAALAMVREGYQVRFEASKYYWNFRFGGSDRRQLYCFLSPIADGKLVKQVEAHSKGFAKHSSKQLTGNIWEDVTVKIGRIHGSDAAKIRVSDFRDWLKVSLDLDRPGKLIKTPYGDLIRDPRFAGRIYLKSLLLDGNSSSKRFRFGYNLHQGHVNRDRQKLTSPAKEAENIAKIWEKAIEGSEPNILSEYVEMLRDNTKWADVHLAEDNVSETTATSIWEYLMAENHEGKFFYHDHRNGDQEVELIKRSLRKEPVQLPDSIWKPLKKFELVRTAEQQRYHLLHRAPIAVFIDTPYAAGVKRALRSSLALDPITNDLTLVFKNGDNVGLDLLLDNKNLMIHKKWLDFQASHQNASCWLSRMVSHEEADIIKFSCNHVVKDLYDLILDELARGPSVHRREMSERAKSLRILVSECLHQMPLKIKMRQGTELGQIKVSWVDAESDLVSKLHGLNLEFRVTLHRESSCAGRRFDLLAPENGGERLDEISPVQVVESRAGCSCPEQVTSQKDSKVIFYGLGIDEEYFAMVSRTESKAFYGLPPKSLRPNKIKQTTPNDAPAWLNDDIYEDLDDNQGDLNTRNYDTNANLRESVDVPDFSETHISKNSSLNKECTGVDLSDPRSETQAISPVPLISPIPDDAQETLRLRTENETLRKEVEWVNKSLLLKSQDLHEAQATLGQQKLKGRELEEAKSSLVSLLHEVSELRSSHAALQNLEAEKDLLQQKIDDVQARLTQQQELVTTPEIAALDEMRIENDELREANKTLAVEVQRLNEDLEKITSALQVVLNSRNSGSTPLPTLRAAQPGTPRSHTLFVRPRREMSEEDQGSSPQSTRASKRARTDDINK